jgi:hypothetical protein
MSTPDSRIAITDKTAMVEYLSTEISSLATNTMTFRSRIRRAVELYNLGRDQEALSELHRLVMEKPTNAEGYLLQARINWRSVDNDAVIAAAKTLCFGILNSSRRISCWQKYS